MRSSCLALSLAVVSLAGCTMYRPREVAVVVRDAETHKPIPGATVHVSNPHIGSDPVVGTAGPIGIALVPFTPAGGEPVMIEAVAATHGAEPRGVGEGAV